jgi:hypothetical protein
MIEKLHLCVTDALAQIYGGEIREVSGMGRPRLMFGSPKLWTREINRGTSHASICVPPWSSMHAQAAPTLYYVPITRKVGLVGWSTSARRHNRGAV